MDHCMLNVLVHAEQSTCDMPESWTPAFMIAESSVVGTGRVKGHGHK
jgi:hypothetical protein